jgi:hypothetical protein
LINPQSISPELLEEAINSIQERAESGPQYSEIFVDTNVLNMLINSKHQLIYGRRGTGKTHLLGRLKDYYKMSLEEHKIMPVYIDGKNISEGNIPSEVNPGISLLVSYRRFIESILSEIEKFIQDKMTLNTFEKWWPGGEKKERLKRVRETLGNLRKVMTMGEVEFGAGEVVSERTDEKSLNKKTSLTFDSQIQAKLEQPSANLSLGLSRVSTKNTDDSIKIIWKGITMLNFQKIGEYLDSIIQDLELSSVGILFDEWSAIKLNLQPFLAYMIKTTLVSGRKVFVKLACIPIFTNLDANNSTGQSIGFPISEEIFVAANLDRIYNAYIEIQSVTTFLLQVLQKHIGYRIKPLLKAEFLDALDYFNKSLFENDETITELALSSGGVPRDFLRIFVRAFNKSKNNLPISTKNVREATHEFFQEEKKTLLKNKDASQLFEDIYDKICRPAETTIFFITTNLESKLINEIWHHRIIHILYQGRSAFASGKLGTYDVYAIDHGRYINLTSIKKGEDMYKGLVTTTTALLNLFSLPQELSKLWDIGKTPLKNKFSIDFASKINVDSTKIDSLFENCEPLIADKIVMKTPHQ